MGQRLALHLLGCSSLRLAIHKMKASIIYTQWPSSGGIERTFNDQHRSSNPWSKNIIKHGTYNGTSVKDVCESAANLHSNQPTQHLFPELAHIASKAHRTGEPWWRMEWFQVPSADFLETLNLRLQPQRYDPYGRMVNMRWRLHLVASSCHF